MTSSKAGKTPAPAASPKTKPAAKAAPAVKAGTKPVTKTTVATGTGAKPVAKTAPAPGTEAKPAARVSTKSIVKAGPQPVAALDAKPKKAAEKAPVAEKKNERAKVVRDSFTFPESDYQKISELKKSCLALGVHAKKSEILRAGLVLLSQLSGEELKKTISAVEKIKTGRPLGSTAEKA